MKTINLIFLAFLIGYSSYCFSQEISENELNYISLAPIDYKTVEADAPNNTIIKYKQAAFASTSAHYNLQEFINTHIQFPDQSRTIGASGSVLAQFEILEDGSLGKIYFIQSPDPLFTKEVERVLRMAPRYKPAIKEGIPVRSFEQVKINFKLQ